MTTAAGAPGARGAAAPGPHTGVPRLLLFTPVAPMPSGVGGIFLHDLCRMYPGESLAACVVSDDPASVRIPYLPADRTLAVPRPPEYGFNRLGRHVTRATRAVAERWVRRRHVASVVHSAARFGKRFGAALLWVPLSSPTALHAAAPLARELGVPLLTTVWDPPEYWLRHYWGLEGAALAALMRSFADAMRVSVRCGVMSEEMARTYREQFGTAGVVMRHGIAEERWLPPAAGLAADATLTIGFAGSMYARDEWQALLRALDSVDWRVAGRRVRVRVCGPGWDLPLASRAHVELLGWRTVDETIALMSECDLCYLPYWLAPEFAVVTRLAFPTKLSTYLASGRPVLFHGPADSSPAHFFGKYRAAACCHSDAAPALIGAITSLVEDPAAYARAVREGRRALAAEFTQRLFRQRFADLLGIDEPLLAPV